jgi:hypothetical protein
MHAVAAATLLWKVRQRAAADEVDDFQAVAVFEDSLRPAVARGDFAVEFDGDAVGFHGEGFDQSRQGELGGRRRGFKIALFSIDVQFHGFNFLTWKTAGQHS